MESIDVELIRRDKFFNLEEPEIHGQLLMALCKLTKENRDRKYVLIEDIDEEIFESKHPNAQEMKDTAKPPDERYTGHFDLLHKKGYLRLSSIKVYPEPKAYEWCREGGPI